MSEPGDVAFKRCPDCKGLKPASEWGRNRRVKDGLAAYCKACVAVRNRAQYVANQERRKREAVEYWQQQGAEINARRRASSAIDGSRERNREWRERNAERIAEQTRAWRAAHPDYSKHWRVARGEQRRAWEQAHRDNNRDRYREYNRQQRLENPERFRVAKHKYRASRVSNGHVAHTPEQWQAKFAYWGKRCWICRADLSSGSYDIDHVKPLNKGGMDCLANLRPACAGCNRGKRDTWPYSKPEGSHGRRS